MATISACGSLISEASTVCPVYLVVNDATDVGYDAAMRILYTEYSATNCVAVVPVLLIRT